MSLVKALILYIVFMIGMSIVALPTFLFIAWKPTGLGMVVTMLEKFTSRLKKEIEMRGI